MDTVTAATRRRSLIVATIGIAGMVMVGAIVGAARLWGADGSVTQGAHLLANGDYRGAAQTLVRVVSAKPDDARALI